ncbi:MAG: ABC transporter ATP-binding protein [Thermanaerothrix sp.]|nr:ABC transporter ATP-binding protein [Thermanaerothrix sp.]
MLLSIESLRTSFHTDHGVVKAVDGVSFSIKPGETLCVVGESGCGKSVTALSVMGLLQKPSGRVDGGRIVFEGTNLLELPEQEMRKVRGNSISMIFQEPMTSLNPVFTVGDQIREPLMLHQGLNRQQADERALEMLVKVGISEPKKRLESYPHQMSGGMRQRVMIAMALACNPKLLIADEPTTALDVTVQAQILDLMRNLKKDFGSAIMMITHDLGVVAEMADRVVVMYGGQVVEEALVREAFKDPLLPYTKGLLESIPRLDEDREKLPVIPGSVPDPRYFPKGCRFSNRCRHCSGRCVNENPPLYLLEDGRKTRCFLYDGDKRVKGVEKHD